MYVFLIEDSNAKRSNQKIGQRSEKRGAFQHRAYQAHQNGRRAAGGGRNKSERGSQVSFARIDVFLYFYFYFILFLQSQVAERAESAATAVSELGAGAPRPGADTAQGEAQERGDGGESARPLRRGHDAQAERVRRDRGAAQGGEDSARGARGEVQAARGRVREDRGREADAGEHATHRAGDAQQEDHGRHRHSELLARLQVAQGPLQEGQGQKGRRQEEIERDESEIIRACGGFRSTHVLTYIALLIFQFCFSLIVSFFSFNTHTHI